MNFPYYIFHSYSIQSYSFYIFICYSYFLNINTVLNILL
nr:MAG TPA: hypothetical protein [Caudoviricetes sp.]